MPRGFLSTRPGHTKRMSPPVRRLIATVEVDGPDWLMCSVNADDVDLGQTVCLTVFGREEELVGIVQHVREEVA